MQGTARLKEGGGGGGQQVMRQVEYDGACAKLPPVFRSRVRRRPASESPQPPTI